MADQTTAAAGAETQAAPVTPETKQAGKTYTEAEFNDHFQRQREKHEREMKKVAEERDALVEAKKTDAEKALDAKLKERDTEWEQKLKQQEIHSELKLKLAEAGYSPKLAPVVLAAGMIEKVEDIPSAITEALADIPKSNRVDGQGAGGGGMPKGADYPKGGRWTRAQVQEVRQAGRYAEFKKSIEEADAKGEIRG